MGLFGSIFNVVGKVAKAGLSVATRGVSDKVFQVLKGRGQVKAVSTSPALTEQQRAVVEKWRDVSPGVIRTESALPSMFKRQPPQVARAMKRRPRAAASMPVKRRRKGPKALRPKRAPPSGGLDLRALSASWKAAGKPGTWQGWIAANKHVRKA